MKISDVRGLEIPAQVSGCMSKRKQNYAEKYYTEENPPRRASRTFFAYRVKKKGAAQAPPKKETKATEC